MLFWAVGFALFAVGELELFDTAGADFDVL
jgi:hypothetical protein